MFHQSSRFCIPPRSVFAKRFVYVLLTSFVQDGFVIPDEGEDLETF